MTGTPGSSFCMLRFNLKVINHSPSLVPYAGQIGNCHVVQFFEKGVQPRLSDSQLIFQGFYGGVVYCS
jgi:hypothetical protein